jgi:hypothetical protein
VGGYRLCVNLLRAGDWQPGGVSPALLVIQLAATLQAALRGLDYWHPAGPVPPTLALVESAAPPHVWAALMGGSAVVVLLGLAGRWPAVMILGHLLLAAVYLGVGVPVLAASAVGPLTAALLAVGGGALGTWALVHGWVRDLPARLLAVLLMCGAVILLSRTLGTDYRTGTGLLSAGVLHTALALGVWVGTLRRRLTPQAEEEVLR